MGGWLKRWGRYLSEPVDAASIAVVRIVLGVMIAWDAVRYCANGAVDEYYILPKWHFTYLYFDWVRPWPGNGMYVHFAVIFGCAVLVALGLYYRAAIVALFLAYTYVFLLEETAYMNHHYLIALLCFLMIWMQPHRVFSLDRRRHPEWPTTAPRWNVLLLRFQLFVVYFYGAVAKLNADWLAGEPMYSEIVRRADDVPALAARLPPAPLAYAIAYGGLLLDLTIAFTLLSRRTRRVGYVLAVLFHLVNDVFLQIGVFSYLMIGAITVFFDPQWPRQLQRRWRPAPSAHSSALPIRAAPVRVRWLGLALLHLYVLAQLLIPLRHWVYPGRVGWTDEGYRFSWHMMLRRKRATIAVMVTDPATGRRWQIDPAADLRPRQLEKLHEFPDMMVQYAHYKRDELRAGGMRDPIITVDWQCSLNGAPPQPLVDPTFNFAAAENSIWPATWILPEAARR
jgi:HTTM domain/Vitamin K-dependent gamma-carboxylase, lumenal domain